MRFRILILLLVTGLLTMFAREERRVFRVGFPISSIKIDPSYGDNAAQLAALDSMLDLIAAGKVVTTTPIYVEGWTSPDGPLALNQRLSRQRSKALLNYMVNRHPQLADRIFESEPIVAWNQLSEIIAASDEPWRDQVLAIIADSPAPGRADTRNQRLKALQGGKVWRVLANHYLPQLRIGTGAVLSIIVDEVPGPEAMPPVLIEEDVTLLEPKQPEAVPVILPDTVLVEPAKPNQYLAITTNMLYDAAAVPNLGFDIYLKNNFSLFGDWQYAWWWKKRKAIYWRTYGGYLGARWWFGRKAAEKPLQGHHIGIYGQVLLYDFEWSGKGYLSGDPGKNIFHHPTWGGGIEYGYSLPVAKRINIDFNLGVGYLTGQYYEYEPQDGHFVWLSKKNRHYFGPTKLEISLVWLIGRGNVNPQKQKGGTR